jgi:hypothetical protein
METAVPISSTPVWRPQVSGPDFGQRPNLDAPRRAFEEKLAPDVIAEVREALKRDWFIMERNEHRRQLENNWSPPDSLRLGSEMIRLDRSPHERGNSLPVVAKWRVPSFCNKATVFYWMQSATVNTGDADGLAILGGIWNAWADTLGRQPQFQLDDFFAVPVSVTKKNATAVPEILRAHQYICSQVRGTLEKKGASAERDPRYFGLHPLCEALIAVFDEYKFVGPSYIKQADGFRHYDNVAQHQSILLVRTGKEDRLSAPIRFDSLKDKALPLARNEDMGIIDIIRIPLQVGVRFVANLLLREEAAFPESVLGGPHISKELDHPFIKCEREAFAWGERQLARAQEQGKISLSSTAADVKEEVLLHKRLDENLEYYAPPPFKLGWV